MFFLSSANDNSPSALSFSPISLVSASLGNISSIVSRNTEIVDESYYETRTKEVFVEGTRKWYKPWTWFDDGDHYETRSYQEKIEKYKDAYSRPVQSLATGSYLAEFKVYNDDLYKNFGKTIF